MSKIFLTSDLHFNHSRGFIYEPRGFSSVEEMNNATIANYNSVVAPEDDVYILGDLCLGGAGDDVLAENQRLIESLNGRMHIILGNHDTPKRIAMYTNCKNLYDVKYADMITYRGYHFYLSHYPTLTGNLEKESLKQCTINIHGHTHSKNPFYEDIPFMFNCALDAHNNFPVLLDDAIDMMKQKVYECKEEL